jgi:hypothetical protein
MDTKRSEIPDVGDAEYRSYLLRLWQEETGGERRALLQDVLSSECRYFSSLEELVAYLDTDQARVEGSEDGHLETE